MAMPSIGTGSLPSARPAYRMGHLQALISAVVTSSPSRTMCRGTSPSCSLVTTAPSSTASGSRTASRTSCSAGVRLAVLAERAAGLLNISSRTARLASTRPERLPSSSVNCLEYSSPTSRLRSMRGDSESHLGHANDPPAFARVALRCRAGAQRAGPGLNGAYIWYPSAHQHQRLIRQVRERIDCRDGVVTNTRVSDSAADAPDISPL